MGLDHCSRSGSSPSPLYDYEGGDDCHDHDCLTKSCHGDDFNDVKQKNCHDDVCDSTITDQYDNDQTKIVEIALQCFKWMDEWVDGMELDG